VISEELMDELAGIGDENQVQAAIRRYREAGVTLPAAGPFSGHTGAAGYEETLEVAVGA
jgi:hypothetical protein